MKVKKNEITYTIIISGLLFFSFLPDFDTIFGGLSSYLRIAAEGASLTYGIVLTGKRRILDGFLVFFIALQLQLLLSAFYNSTEWFPFVKRGLRILAICFLIKGACKRCTIILLKSIIMVFILLGLINLIYRIPDHEITHVIGTGSIYYFGSDNEAVSPMLLLFITSLLFWFMKGGNFLSIIGMVIPVFTAFYSQSGTGMMVYLIFIIGFILVFVPGFRGLLERLSNAKIMMIAFGSYYLILWGVSIAKITFLASWINKVTGKNALTFTNRDVIWLEAMNIIRSNPIFGIGYGEGAGGNGVYVNGLYRGAHNTMLQWGVNGGVITIIFFVILLYLVFKTIEEVKFPLKYYLYLGSIVFLIAMSMENYSNGLHFLPLMAVIYYTDITPYENNFSKMFLFRRKLKKRKRLVVRYSESIRN